MVTASVPATNHCPASPQIRSADSWRLGRLGARRHDAFIYAPCSCRRRWRSCAELRNRATPVNIGYYGSVLMAIVPPRMGSVDGVWDDADHTRPRPRVMLTIL